MKEITLSLDREKSYLLGLSGGADSVCLFHLLKDGGYRFSAAHINHGIRGDEADRDEEFCRNLCRENGVDFHLLRRDVPALAKEQGKSLEEAARDVRYSFFEEIMREKSIPVLLTAHNADDNAEALILSLVRGCSPSGACGIAPIRALAYGVAERPLLGCKKKDIVAFCHENSFDFVTDSTNADVSYPRNRIRQNILPELEAINPEFLSAFARFTESERLDSSFLDREAERFTETLLLSDISSIPYPITSRALAIAAHRAGASPEAVHIEKMIEMAKKGTGSLSLPGSVRAECRGGRIVFLSDTREKKRATYPDYEPIDLDLGENELPHGKLMLVSGELTNDSAQVYKLSTSALINLDRIKGKIYARPRREGDRILIGGMHKSLKKLISEKLPHLSLEERRALPVICLDDEIVWVPYLGVSDSFRGSSHTICYLAEKMHNI
ncbi:MAG: tRNA lysidine(34) synthetase TilS [Clostridia bacterium]|nr:tRNA lysidine(34) synthetase TilS [Clostridia bacterium]